MSMEEKQNQNAGQPENKAKIEPVIRKETVNQTIFEIGLPQSHWL